jgi:anti-sigma regulatory factor (Ser/Thr protein kinase)
VDDGELDLELSPSAHAPATARHEVAAIAAELHPTLRENLALLVSELVTNSVRHATPTRGGIALRAWIIPPAVRVQVGDWGAGYEPNLALPDPEHDGGLGMWLVASLADQWGICREERTWSWFEFHGAADRSTSALGLFLDAVSDWPLRPRELAWSTAARLGPPDEVAPRRLAWATPRGDLVTVVCPDPLPSDRADHIRRGMVRVRGKGRWWLETLRRPRPAAWGQGSLDVGR